jgi:RIP metalloprotease RseP
MNLLIELLAFAVAIGVLVVVHEYGHYSVARLCGVKVLRFSIGFGKPLFQWVSPKTGTEWIIAALPLGGYVKIPGMHRPAPGDLRQTLPPAERDQLAADLDELDAALERDDEAAAVAVVERLKPHLGANRQLPELEWALAPDAYWRQSAAK